MGTMNKPGIFDPTLHRHMRCRPQYLRYMHRDQRWLVPVAIHELLRLRKWKDLDRSRKSTGNTKGRKILSIDYILIIDYWDYWGINWLLIIFLPLLGLLIVYYFQKETPFLTFLIIHYSFGVLQNAAPKTESQNALENPQILHRPWCKHYRQWCPWQQLSWFGQLDTKWPTSYQQQT